MRTDLWTATACVQLRLCTLPTRIFYDAPLYLLHATLKIISSTGANESRVSLQHPSCLRTQGLSQYVG